MFAGGLGEILEFQLYVRPDRLAFTIRYMQLLDAVRQMDLVPRVFTRVVSIKIVLDGRPTRGCRIMGFILVLEMMSAIETPILGDTINMDAELPRMRHLSKLPTRGRLQMCFCRWFSRA